MTTPHDRCRAAAASEKKKSQVRQRQRAAVRSRCSSNADIRGWRALIKHLGINGPFDCFSQSHEILMKEVREKVLAANDL